mgnify:FL=1
MKILLKNATLLPEYGYGARPVSVGIRNRKIAGVWEGENADFRAEETVDCGGNLLMPAFCNTHCHAAMTLFRGYGEDLPLQEWLETRIFPAEEKLTFRAVYHASMLAIAEMLRHGIASFSDMYMFEDATAEAVLATGIKANLSRSLVSFDPDIDMAKESRTVEAVRLAEWYHGCDEGRLRVDFSLHAEYTNVPRACEYVAELARRFRTGMQIHLSETEREHSECMARWGKTPTGFFRDTGVLDVPTTAAHCVWVTDDDIAVLAEKGVTVAHNPVSNLKLGSGVAPLRRLLDAGVNVALGTDGAASNNRLDILRELQTAALIHKGVNRNPAILRAEELVPLATVNGMRAQGRPDSGRVEKGFLADLILIDRQSLHNQPCCDDYAMLAFSADAGDVKMTMVDGRILWQNGAYTSIDEERLRYDSHQTFSHYFD